MEELDILTLDNNKDYVINKIISYRNKEYLLLIEVDKDENILDEKLILEKVKTDKGYILSIIKDEIIHKIVTEKFAKILLEDLK